MPRGEPIGTEIKEKGIQMLSNGMSVGQVSEQLKVNRSTVYAWKNKMGTKGSVPRPRQSVRSSQSVSDGSAEARIKELERQLAVKDQIILKLLEKVNL